MKLKKYFIKINTASNYPAKPDITTFLDCMQFTNNDPTTTIIFEDSIVGIKAAKKTKAKVIKVTDVQDTIKKIQEYL